MNKLNRLFEFKILCFNRHYILIILLNKSKIIFKKINNFIVNSLDIKEKYCIDCTGKYYGISILQRRRGITLNKGEI